MAINRCYLSGKIYFFFLTLKRNKKKNEKSMTDRLVFYTLSLQFYYTLQLHVTVTVTTVIINNNNVIINFIYE